MLFFYIRHGDPTYHPDALTPLGRRQADAVAKRLALFGLDRIYTSSSNRAIETAQPTCELLKLESTELDFANEHHAWMELGVVVDGRRRWLFASPEHRPILASAEVRALGDRWYEHEAFAEHDYKSGIERVARETDALFASLGYEHIRGSGTYRAVRPNDERVALFAHQGFGLAFFSQLLDIPYPQFALQFDMCHSGVTVVEFKDEGGIAIPKICTFSSDSHLYREGLPLDYNHQFRF